ncbi:hypothetical protein IQ782_05630 [Salipiger pacificus]|uniref:Alginate biosynthesis protein AlgF n=2 Tax=Salipiger mangrovisoli TaxID=2865933 RepID=A0ABR9WYE3_9RHOB|nr:hypothetical protein [Salipiger mangrovisoli]
MLAILASPVAAQSVDAGNIIVLANEAVNGAVPFNEELLEAARISGAVFAGAQVHQPDSGLLNLKAYVPENWRGEEICVRVLSADGLYEAVNTYRIVPADTTSGPTIADVPFQTQHPAKLSQVSKDSLAVRISLGACSSGQTDIITVAFLNDPAAAGIELLINSFRASRVFVYIGDDAKPPIACTPVDVPARTAYDTLCVLPDLPAEDLLQLTVFRVRDNGSSSSDVITLASPGERGQ